MTVDNARMAVTALREGGFALLLSLEQRVLGRLAAVRLLPSGEGAEGVVVDLLFSSSGIETEICSEADAIEVVPGLVVPVAKAGHLLVMKLDRGLGSESRQVVGGRTGPPSAIASGLFEARARRSVKRSASRVFQNEAKQYKSTNVA